MARFIPEVRPEDIPHDSERLVYEALQALPAGYVVLHSFPWLRPERDLTSQPLHEGEADFVVLHPERGMLVLEVKGGVPELRQRVWFRGGRELRDPFDQARRSRYALLESVEERTRGRLGRSSFTHGDAVIFPHCSYEGPLPLNTDPRILLDARALSALPQRLEAAFEAWRRRPALLSEHQLTELIDALAPRLLLVRCLRSELAAEEQRFVQITSDQRATLSGLLAQDRVLVEGAAGSGKTLLALEFALTLAAQGQRVLFLCFNRHLAAWLQEQLLSARHLSPAAGTLEISTFHAYALGLAKRAGVEFEIPSEHTQEFWDDEVPLILEQAVDLLRRRGEAPSYAALVIDEAQDFAPDWWVTVETLTAGGRNGRLYAFLDLHQSLRGSPRLPEVPLAVRFRLTTNCRNTRSIARSASALIDAQITLLPGMPEGEQPGIRRGQSPTTAAGLALEELRRLLRQGLRPQQLALIGPAAHEKGSLAHHHHADSVRLVTDATEWRRGAGVLVTTARAFKGLEADVIILYDLSGFSSLFTKTDLYVAWTRACHRLIVICHGPEVRASVEAALAAAEPRAVPPPS